MIPMPENGKLRAPADGDILIWVSKPGRTGASLQPVEIHGKLSYSQYRVRKVYERTYHTARAECLLWPESLKSWSEVTAARLVPDAGAVQS